MFVRDLIVSCLRRWYLLLVGLILAVVLAYAAFGAVSPTYEAKASMVLVPPQVAVTTGENPFLYLGGLDQALGVLQVKVTAPEIADPLLNKYDNAEVSVAKDDETSGPILVVLVTGQDPESTMGLLRGMQKTVPATLTDLQKQLKVPEASVIGILTLAADDEPTVVRKKQIQLTAVAGALGAGGTVLLTGLADGLILRRRDRKAARAVSAASEFSEPGEDRMARKSARARKPGKQADTAVRLDTDQESPSSDDQSVMSRSENRR